MAQYIDKAAIVAEIYKLKKSHDNWSCMGKSFHKDYETLLSFIDTLEVKEIGVDLGDPKGDKSAICIVDTKKFEVKEVDLDFTKKVDMWIGDNEDSNGFFNVQELAKHFFELGLTVSNKAQKGE